MAEKKKPAHGRYLACWTELENAGEAEVNLRLRGPILHDSRYVERGGDVHKVTS